MDADGVALVNPYEMYPTKPRAWGILLRSPGELYLHYASSIEGFFEEGLSREYLKPNRPPAPEPAKVPPPCNRGQER